MKSYKSLINSLLVCLILIGVGCKSESERDREVFYLPYYEDASFTPVWLDPNQDDLSSFHKIPPFQLLNQEGDTLTEKAFEGKIYVTDFFFTSCPGICRKMTSNMTLLQEEFEADEDILLLSHSVTPSMDSVPVLKRYAAYYDINPKKWHLATGDKQLIYTLGRQYYFVEEDQGLARNEEAFLHTENFVLIDSNRHIRGIYNGLNKAAIQQLIADIHTLKAES
ncbi:MAG: SCO family protein [Bacteroidota bacterium]